MTIEIRNTRSSDHARVIAVVDDWWGGRSLSQLLPHLFFEHFQDSSFIAEQNGELIGFLVGFFSQSQRDEAYIHFVGVHPDHRQHGLARELYQRFFTLARAAGRTAVRCITSPVNTRSIAFHRAMGFTIVPGNAELDGVSLHRNHDGVGGDRVLFRRTLP